MRESHHAIQAGPLLGGAHHVLDDLDDLEPTSLGELHQLGELVRRRLVGGADADVEDAFGARVPDFDGSWIRYTRAPPRSNPISGTTRRPAIIAH